MNVSDTPPPLVISIQSQVTFGHVGNSAAVFPMQAVGLEVAAIPTVLFSNTPHYPTLRGAPLPPHLFADLLLGAEERGLPGRAAWLVTGYIGSVEVAELTADFIARCKAANPGLRYLCDPVMGDHEPGLYVPEAIAHVIRDRMLPLADLATPNAFELAYLTGQEIADLDDVVAAGRALHLAAGGRLIATGCVLADTPANHLESVIVAPDGPSRHPTPHLPVALPGTGDLFSGLVTAALGRGRDLTDAVDLAQELTGLALAHAARIGAHEVVLSDPGFRAALLRI
ncbi:pyridoxal kinase [Paracoccus marinaquae]|uniref:Pyridoxal kinase n=1 Tax=Paracoccus marinaquae TaxID=2841926 RepID=A0ABS6AJS2_9RHOB|nr:pyridoxal kinase [Paracoccus marinaquae]MBU3030157.1 pyridoxal kinase [Paracoccus marinaquae]